jgi:sugar/nucleoside kinase (ribokinase family)
VSAFDVLVLGDANPDLVMRGGNVHPAFGQAERLVDEAKLTIGGSGAIFACGAVRLGLSVGFVGVVGDDVFGRFMREELDAHGVDTSGLVVDPEHPTGLTVVLSQPEDRAMLTALGPIGKLSAAGIDPELIASARHVHVSSYYLQRSLAPDLPQIFADVRSRGGTTSVDPNWDPSGRWGDGLIQLLALVDVFMPNAVETCSLGHTSELDGAIARLREAGAGTVIVKLDAGGARAVSAGLDTSVEGIDVAVRDTTGAGDSFDAGFLAAWLDGEPIDQALTFANACGAISTTATGGTTGQATREEALALLEKGPVG